MKDLPETLDVWLDALGHRMVVLRTERTFWHKLYIHSLTELPSGWYALAKTPVKKFMKNCKYLGNSQVNIDDLFKLVKELKQDD